MRFIRSSCTSLGKKGGCPIIPFWLITFIIIINSSTLNAQQIKSSFVLDTTQAQIYPYDLDFNLKLVDSKAARIKYVYLIRIDNKGKVVYDNQTSFYRIGQQPRAKHKILGSLFKSQDHIKKNSASMKLWQKEKKDKENALRIETDEKKKVQLKNEIEGYRINIEDYENHQRKLDRFSKNANKYIKDGKNERTFEPLVIKGRDKDTLIVEVKPLKPNQDYLILAVNETNKIVELKKLIKDYLGGGEVEDKLVKIIPRRYLSNDTIKFFEFKSKSIKDGAADIIKERKRKVPHAVEFRIPSKIFIDAFEKAKDNDIADLLDASKVNPKMLKKYTGNIRSPGPFKYPITSGLGNWLNDSSIDDVPNDYNKDFRLINAIISEFENYGDALVSGKYKLEKDSKNDFKVNFSPKTDLNSQLNTITEHLNLAIRAQQSFFIMAEAELENIEVFKGYFTDLIEILSANRDIIAKNVEANSEVNSILAGMNFPFGLQTQSINKSTFTYNFLTRNSGVIKQSFGFVYYFSDKQGFSGAAPYTGIDYQFRSTNENTEFWKIRDWKKFFSVQLGVPLFASQLTEGAQRKHLVGDSFSLYTGLGINLGHSVKIGYGAILFRSIDGNAIGDPSYEINAVHAVSLGINFRLIPLFKNIFGSDNAINLIP